MAADNTKEVNSFKENKSRLLLVKELKPREIKVQIDSDSEDNDDVGFVTRDYTRRLLIANPGLLLNEDEIDSEPPQQQDENNDQILEDAA